jgi:phosphohistidine phosphatase SixA
VKLRWRAASLIAMALLGAGQARANDDEAWKLLKEGGQVVLMRHAQTDPGVGDPPNMRIDDCTTQRNLTEAGRKQARAIGDAIRAHGVQVDRVVSSPMCRCLETGKLAFGRVDETQHAASTRSGTEDPAKLVREMRALATEKHRGGIIVMVSHGRTIAAVTDIQTEPGEMIIVTPQGDGKFEVHGRLMAAPVPK